MKKEEKRIVNEKLVFAWLAIQLCYITGMTSVWFSGAALWSVVPFTLVGILAPVYCLVKRKSIQYMDFVVAVCLTIQLPISYFVFLTPIVFVYGFASMMMLTLYENKKLSLGFSIITSLEILFFFYWDSTHVKLFDIASRSIGVCSIFSCLAVALVVVHTVKAVSVFRKNSIEQEAEKTKELNGTLASRNKQVHDSMTDTLAKLQGEVLKNKNVNVVIEEIASAMNTIASALQSQSTETSALRSEVAEIEKHALGLNNTQEVCTEAIAAGVVVLEQTRNGAVSVRESSVGVQSCVGALVQRVSDVRKVIDIISDISSKTKLLSINASIEAAHAGASGAGFSVVADEIKHLAGMTQEAITSITDYLAELEEYTGTVTEKVNAIDSEINEQVQQLSNVETSFDKIKGAAEQLTPVIETVIQKVNNTASFNDKLVEEITMISATSEELSASADSINNLSTESLEELAKIVKIIEEVMQED